VKRIDVSSSRVRVLGATRPGAVRAPVGGLGGKLRRFRLRLAIVLGALLVVAAIVTDANQGLAMVAAVVVGIFHLQIGRKLPSYAAVQVSWILAFALLVAAVFVPLVTTVLSLAVIVAVVALIVLMLRLGDRA
jgi:hypothetical protein